MRDMTARAHSLYGVHGPAPVTPKAVEALIIGATESFCLEAVVTLATEASIHVCRSCQGYPDSAVLQRILRATGARILFLDMADADRAGRLVASLEFHDPNLQVVAVGTPSASFSSAFRHCGGIREFVAWPFRATEVAAAIERRVRVISKLPALPEEAKGKLYAFCPAKAGSGASTIAANAASLLAAQQPRKTLLSDLDLWSGVVAFRHRLKDSHTLHSVLERVASIDEGLWVSLVAQAGGLDLLPGTPMPAPLLDGWAMSRFFDFVRWRYEHVLFDCSGELENFSLSAMQECDSIFVVCTQELDALHVARTKLNTLRRLELGGRVRVLVNRFHKQHALGLSQIAELLETNVELAFTNDYKNVVESVQEGKPVKPECVLGRQYQTLADRMRGPAPQARRERRSGWFGWTGVGSARQLAKA